MTEEEHKLQDVASEDPVVDEEEHVEAEEGEDNQKMVPLAAMIANRKKAQEESRRADRAEAQLEAYRQMHAQATEVPETEEDLSALVEKKDLKGLSSSMKREIMEQLYQDMKPEGVQKIDKYLNAILEKKPWLKQSIDSALNRYARAEEIVDDYMHLVVPRAPVKKSAISDGERIVQNANKPGSPMAAGKSAYPTGAQYLKSIQGSKEFREYRQKILRGEA